MDRSKYYKINEPINSKLYSVLKNGYWGVIDENENIIVPFNKYQWIGGFRNGLAKVMDHRDNSNPKIRTKKVTDDWQLVPLLDHERVSAQGIINERGEEVLPCEYTVYNFYTNDYPSIIAIKDGIKHRYTFDELSYNNEEI